MKRSRCGEVDEQQSEESNGNLLEDIMAAQTTFTSQYNSFLTLAKQLEGRIRGVEEREKKCEEREKKVQETEKEVERKHEVWQERKQEVKERERDVTRREEMLEEIDNRMKTNAAKLPNVIRFNVGGKSFAATKERLLKYKGSLFEQLIMSDHPQLLPTGEIFIERDPQYFRFVFSYVLEGSLHLCMDDEEYEAIAKEFTFCNIPLKFESPPPSPPAEPSSPTPTHSSSVPIHSSSTPSRSSSNAVHFSPALLSPSPAATSSPSSPHPSRLSTPFPSSPPPPSSSLPPPSPLLPSPSPLLPLPNPFPDSIHLWLPGRTFKLLYKASENGFGASEFHKRCDDKGATITIIRSDKGYTFGGYTSSSWDTSSNWKSDPDAFIFTLTNPHLLPPTKYPQTNNNTQSIKCTSGYGPIFGTGHDICVANNSNSNTSSYTSFNNYSYEDNTGKGQYTFTGNFEFVSKEIEVYSVVVVV